MLSEEEDIGTVPQDVIVVNPTAGAAATVNSNLGKSSSPSNASKVVAV